MKTSELAKTFAREMRKNQTNAERILWEKLGNKKFAGLKFTRQHPIYYFKNNQKRFFIADFFCNKIKLVIELDGRIHEKQKDYDEAREDLLKNKKLSMIRFNNEEIENKINACLVKLKRFIDEQSLLC